MSSGSATYSGKYHFTFEITRSSSYYMPGKTYGLTATPQAPPPQAMAWGCTLCGFIYLVHLHQWLSALEEWIGDLHDQPGGSRW